MSARVLSDEDIDRLFELSIERTAAARTAEQALTAWCRCEHPSTEDCEHKQAHAEARERCDESWRTVINFVYRLPLVSDLAAVSS